MNFLDKINNKPNSQDETIQKLKSSKLPLVMWGAGDLACHVIKYLTANELKLDAIFVDKNFIGSINRGCLIKGMPVQTFDEICSEYKEFNLLMGFINYGKGKDLQSKYNKIKSAFCLSIDAIYNIEPITYDMLVNDEQDFQWTYEKLADDISKSSYIEYLNAKISGYFEQPNELVNTKAYFDNNFTQFKDDEIFVDCGAFDGDSILNFLESIKSHGHTHKAIYALEPDEANFSALEKLTERVPNLHCIKKGAWSEKIKLHFKNEGSMNSSISESGDSVIDCDTIDNILSGNPCSFIKMDIEGAELQALKGAERTIRTYCPKLAICAYHKADDLITIPQYLNSIVPNYKFYFRLHTFGIIDAVLYAVID